MTQFLGIISTQRLLIASTILIACSLFLITHFASASFTNDNEQSSYSSDVKKSTSYADDDAPHTLIGSYYSIENNTTAKLLLNNKGVKPLEVQPTLYNLAGQQLELPPVFVEATSFRFINLTEWAAVGGESFKQGSIRLFHRGKDLVLGAQIYLTDEAHSLSFEEKLAEIGKFDSRRLEGVWAMPSRQTDVKIALSNTLDCELIVTAHLTRKPHVTSEAQTFTLAPHETRVLNLQDFPSGKQAVNSEAVALSLEHNGTKESLLARAFISDSSNGYSNLAQFSNPFAGQTSKYHGAGLHLEMVEGESLKPIVVVRNTATTNANLIGQVPYTRTDGTMGTIVLPETRLRPNEIGLLDMREVVRRSEREEIKVAGLEIEYNTAPGSVIIAVHSESASGNQVFRVPMWDALAQRTATGGYPWQIEGTSTTKAYLKNITDRPQKYVTFFNWENGGMYMIGEKLLEPDQTVEIDVKDLRDRQVPDFKGRTIPLSLSSGQIQWSLNQEDEAVANGDPLSILAVLGRSEQIDLVKGISSNYACQNCCVGNYVGAEISPESAEIQVGGTANFTAYTLKETCFSFPYEYPEQANAQWSSSNTNIATVSGGTVSGVAGGTTSITANWTAPRYMSNPPCGQGELRYLTGCNQEFSEKMFAESNNVINENQESRLMAPGCGQCFRAGTAYPYRTATVTVKPHVQKIQYQEPGNSTFTDITTTLYVLKGTAVTFKAIPDPPNSTFPSGSPTWSGNSGASGTGETTSVTFNTTSSSTSDYKTVIATSGTSSLTANIVVYELIPVLNPEVEFPGRSLVRFGIKEKIYLQFYSIPQIPQPDIGQLRWDIAEGSGSIANDARLHGGGIFDANIYTQPVTLQLKLVSGPSKGQSVTSNISIIAPNGAYMRRDINQPLIHCYGYSSVGFYGFAHALPTDVSFEKVYFQEGGGTLSAIGFYESVNGTQHDPTNFGSIGSYCNLQTGCQMFADTIYTGKWSGPFDRAGLAQWPIEWQYGFNEIIALGNFQTFTIAVHEQTVAVGGTANITKAGSGYFSREVYDPTSGNGCGNF